MMFLILVILSSQTLFPVQVHLLPLSEVLVVYQTAFLVPFLPILQIGIFYSFAFVISLGVNISELLFPGSHGILFISSLSSSLQSNILPLLFPTCGESLTLISSSHCYFYLPL